MYHDLQVTYTSISTKWACSIYLTRFLMGSRRNDQVCKIFFLGHFYHPEIEINMASFLTVCT